MAVRRRPPNTDLEDTPTGERLRRLALNWVCPALDPATPERVKRARASIAAEMAKLVGRELTEDEIRDWRLPPSLRKRQP